MTERMAQPDKDFVLIPVKEFQAHMDRVAVCVTLLHGIMGALGQVPMFAGFIPPELKAELARLSEG